MKRMLIGILCLSLMVWGCGEEEKSPSPSESSGVRKKLPTAASSEEKKVVRKKIAPKKTVDQAPEAEAAPKIAVAPDSGQSRPENLPENLTDKKKIPETAQSQDSGSVRKKLPVSRPGRVRTEDSAKPSSPVEPVITPKQTQEPTVKPVALKPKLDTSPTEPAVPVTDSKMVAANGKNEDSAAKKLPEPLSKKKLPPAPVQSAPVSLEPAVAKKSPLPSKPVSSVAAFDKKESPDKLNKKMSVSSTPAEDAEEKKVKILPAMKATGGNIQDSVTAIKDNSLTVAALDDGLQTDSFEPEGVDAGISKEEAVERPLYDPINKIDPFNPLVREEKTVDQPEEDEEELAERRRKKKKRRRLTPLERIDLSQLKLVGIIRAESGDKALVQETTGKGYIITVGTKIGRKFGSVTRILRDSIVVEEEEEDELENIIMKERVIKLQKPPGEDYHEL
jgi:Tfp pilus assembly protein PilP